MKASNVLVVALMMFVSFAPFVALHSSSATQEGGAVPRNHNYGSGWVIEAREDVECSNETITVTGYLRVEEGASLTLRNVILMFDGETHLGGIICRGNLTITDNDDDRDTTEDRSIVCPDAADKEIYFIINSTASFVMKNSELYGIGWIHGLEINNGICTETGNFTFDGNYFHPYPGAAENTSGMTMIVATTYSREYARFLDLQTDYTSPVVINNNTLVANVTTNGISFFNVMYPYGGPGINFTGVEFCYNSFTLNTHDQCHVIVSHDAKIKGFVRVIGNVVTHTVTDSYQRFFVYLGDMEYTCNVTISDNIIDNYCGNIAAIQLNSVRGTTVISNNTFFESWAENIIKVQDGFEDLRITGNKIFSGWDLPSGHGSCGVIYVQVSSCYWPRENNNYETWSAKTMLINNNFIYNHTQSNGIDIRLGSSLHLETIESLIIENNTVAGGDGFGDLRITHTGWLDKKILVRNNTVINNETSQYSLYYNTVPGGTPQDFIDTFGDWSLASSGSLASIMNESYTIGMKQTSRDNMPIGIHNHSGGLVYKSTLPTDQNINTTPIVYMQHISGTSSATNDLPWTVNATIPDTWGPVDKFRIKVYAKENATDYFGNGDWTDLTLVADCTNVTGNYLVFDITNPWYDYLITTGDTIDHVTVNSGWNLLSFPLRNITLNGTMITNASSICEALGFDDTQVVAKINGTYYSYIQGESEDDIDLPEGAGIYVWAKSRITLSKDDGDLYEETGVNLKAGWNIVGVASSCNASTYLFLNNSLVAIVGMGLDGHYVNYIGGMSPARDNFDLALFQAYYVYSSRDATIYFNS